MAASGRATPNDTNVLQISRSGVATGLVSIPNRYMHSAVEMISLEDIDRAADLLAGFALRLSGDEDFTP
jgi:endoglucanase